MPDPTIFVLLAVVVLGVVGLTRVARARDPMARRFTMAAERLDLKRVSSDTAARALEDFPRYLDEARGVDLAIGGRHGSGGQLIVAAIGTRTAVSAGRPWYVGAVDDPELRLPVTRLEPRSVRTVRLVAGQGEVVVEDSRIARGWRISSEDPAAAARLLDSEPLRTRLGDALHRPIPWIIGLQMRPGGVAVHLSNPSESPSDIDDVQRLGRLIMDIADALRSGRH